MLELFEWLLYAKTYFHTTFFTFLVEFDNWNDKRFIDIFKELLSRNISIYVCVYCSLAFI